MSEKDWPKNIVVTIGEFADGKGSICYQLYELYVVNPQGDRAYQCINHVQNDPVHLDKALLRKRALDEGVNSEAWAEAFGKDGA